MNRDELPPWWLVILAAFFGGAGLLAFGDMLAEALWEVLLR